MLMLYYVNHMMATSGDDNKLLLAGNLYKELESKTEPNPNISGPVRNHVGGNHVGGKLSPKIEKRFPPK